MYTARLFYVGFVSGLVGRVLCVGVDTVGCGLHVWAEEVEVVFLGQHAECFYSS